MTIWKFELIVADTQTISMPEEARILTVQTQNGSPCIWAMVEENFDMVLRHIRIAGTGHPLPNGYDEIMGKYIGTFQLREGSLIFHVFDEGE